MATVAFADNSEKGKPKEKKETETSWRCCTATLTYNGQYFDHETSCSTKPNGDNLNSSPNCIEAARILKRRYPLIIMEPANP